MQRKAHGVVAGWLLLGTLALAAGCGGAASPLAPVRSGISQTQPTPMPIAPAGDEGPRGNTPVMPQTGGGSRGAGTSGG